MKWLEKQTQKANKLLKRRNDQTCLQTPYSRYVRVFHQDIQTPRSGLKKQGAARRDFLIDLKVFGYLMKHSFEFLIWLLKPFIIFGEIRSKSSQNFMLIRTRCPNHRHGSDFLCFLFMN